MTTSVENTVVWVVSVPFSPTGEKLDYCIEEMDLTDKPAHVVELLRKKMGTGVFTSYEAAQQWVSEAASCTGCCQGKKISESTCRGCFAGNSCNKTKPAGK